MTKSIHLLEVLVEEIKKKGAKRIPVSEVLPKIRIIASFLKNDIDSSIRWSVDDFEARARIIELQSHKADDDEMELYLNNDEIPTLAQMPEDLQLFDRSKFPEALSMMIKNHDANFGINWYSIDCYLRMFCGQQR